MLVQKAPMGWNTWNTFGTDISDELIISTAKVMKEQGYLDAGYEYVVIDDCWSLRQRGADGRIVPDPAKFPRGMKSVGDDLHALGFKFGMYSCAGVMTCARYPSSYDHEFVDAQTFADWGVDFLKYDFCNFPANADCRNRYITMSMALKATGREILLSACNWGVEDPWKWMNSVGAGMYRSTGDIQDNYKSFTNIFKSQVNHFCMSGPSCYNDMDMLTVGMYGKGNVALGKPCTDSEYRTQFALWCMMSAPLMLGADVRNLNDFCKSLVLNKNLLRIDQDPEARPPFIPYRFRWQDNTSDSAAVQDAGTGWMQYLDHGFTMFKQLSNNEFAIGYFNFAENTEDITFMFADAGLPEASGVKLHLTDAFTGEDLGAQHDYFTRKVPGHDCSVLLARFEKA